MGSGITGVGANCHFQRLAGLFIFATASVQHSQVVVGLRQLGKVFGQFGENRNGFAGFVALGQDQALQKTHLCVIRAIGQVSIGAGLGLLKLAFLNEFGYFVCFIGMAGGTGKRQTHKCKHQCVFASLKFVAD